MEAKFVNLIITTLWLSGGFGVLLSLLYMGQYRRRNWWSIGNTVSVPRTLLPLYGALLLFCSGLALQAYLAQANVALWVAGGWALMALLFAMQGIGVALKPRRRAGTPLVAQPSANGLPSGALSALALFFLLVNGGLVGWRALAQYEDGAFDRAFFWRDERAAVTSDAVAQPTVAEGAPAQASAIDQTTTGQANAAQATTALSTAATAPADAPTKAAPPATGLPRSTAQLAAPAGERRPLSPRPRPRWPRWPRPSRSMRARAADAAERQLVHPAGREPGGHDAGRNRNPADRAGYPCPNCGAGAGRGGTELDHP
ncbi:MAG: hypothetical protein R2867_16900 [Caldilineaceae bacterium]